MPHAYFFFVKTLILIFSMVFKTDKNFCLSRSGKINPAILNYLYLICRRNDARTTLFYFFMLMTIFKLNNNDFENYIFERFVSCSSKKIF